MTYTEQEQGYFVCDCGRFAHVWRASVLKRLPRDYHGELCPDCKLWMCGLEKLSAAEHDGSLS